MLTVKRLSLSLPASRRGQAGLVARRVAAELARLPIEGSVHLDHLAVGDVTVPADAGVDQVARAVSRAVTAAVASRRSSGSKGTPC